MGHLRSSMLFGILALFAVLGMGLASGWHSATFHDDDPVHLSAGDRHDPSGRDDPDGAIHVAAHAFSHWMLTPAEAGVFAESMPVTQSHPVPLVRQLAGISGAGLLRPPKG